MLVITQTLLKKLNINVSFLEVMPQMIELTRLFKCLNIEWALLLVMPFVNLLDQFEYFNSAFGFIYKIILVVFIIPNFYKALEDANLLLWLGNTTLQVSALEEIRLVSSRECPKNVDICENSILLEVSNLFELLIVK